MIIKNSIYWYAIIREFNNNNKVMVYFIIIIYVKWKNQKFIKLPEIQLLFFKLSFFVSNKFFYFYSYYIFGHMTYR